MPLNPALVRERWASPPAGSTLAPGSSCPRPPTGPPGMKTKPVASGSTSACSPMLPGSAAVSPAGHGTLTIRQLSGGSLWTSAEVTVEGDEQGILAFHQLAFAGWRAWVDDRPVPATPAPWIADTGHSAGASCSSKCPQVTHRVAIRFGPSAPRLVGATSTLLGWLALAAWALITPPGRSTTPRQRLARGAASLVITLAVIIVGARLLLPLWPPPTRISRNSAFSCPT